MLYKKITVFAVLVSTGLLLSSSSMAQGSDAAAIKQRVLSKLKACGCQEPLVTCGDCPVAAEIKSYVDRLIEAKIPEDKMPGYVLKSFSGDVAVEEKSKVDASRELGQPQLSDGPRLDAQMTPYDFGKVPKSTGSVSHEFALRNNGTKDLIIKSLRTSCVCAKACLRTASANSPDFDFKGSGPEWQGTIKPGETAILEIVIDLATFPVDPKPVLREVFVMSNDSAQPFSIFKVSLEVTGP